MVVRRCRRVALLAALVLAAAVLGGCAQPAPRGDAGLDGALAYLLAQHDADGRRPAGLVPYLVEAVSAAGHDPDSWPEGSPVAQDLALPPADGRYIDLLRPAYALQLTARPERGQARDETVAGFEEGQFGDAGLLNDDAFALWVLAAAGTDFSAPTTRGMADSLRSNASADGGWSWAVGGHGETDTTGFVLTALQGVQDHGGPTWTDASMPQAKVSDFLRSTRTGDGGWSLEPGADSGNCDSTVWGLRSLALLQQPTPDDGWAFLARLRNADGGYAFRPGQASNTLCTAEVATLLGLRETHRLDDPWRKTV